MKTEDKKLLLLLNVVKSVLNTESILVVCISNVTRYSKSDYDHFMGSGCLTSSVTWKDGDNGPMADPISVAVSETEGNDASFISNLTFIILAS